MEKPQSLKKIAAVGDIHIRDTDRGKWTNHFKWVSDHADVLLLCGDLTDTGLVEEAEILAEELKSCKIPIVAVLGNHDHDKENQKEIRAVLTKNQVHVLDGESVVIDNIGFAGIKGFGGGFDNAMLSMFGEQMTKQFVQEAVNDSLKLDAALARLDTDYTDLKKIVLLHYAPIKATVKGEPEEIFPFLGCSRLAEPLDRRSVLAAFHGHAHMGTLEGKTMNGVKVFNVCKHILEKSETDPPFFILEI